DTCEPLSSTPVPKGVAASPMMRKPANSAFDTSVATTAASASEAAPGSRMAAPRGTRLITRTPSFRTRRSRYSPGSTTTCDPGSARPKASAIDSLGRTTTTPDVDDVTPGTSTATGARISHDGQDRQDGAHRISAAVLATASNARTRAV